jgi:hypothetical protein
VDHHLVAIGALCLIVWASLASRLVYPDLVIDYPFMGGDSQDWIANGLAMAGFDVRFSVRPPLLPLVIAVLERLSLLEWLPVGLLGVCCASSVLLYLALRGRCSRWLALTVAVVTLLNHSWLSLGLQVMADVAAACLLFAGTVFFVWGGERHPRLFLFAGLFIGLSAVTQQLALLFPIPAVVAVLAVRRDLLRRWQLYVGGLVSVLPWTVWSGYKWLAFGTAGDVVLRNWDVLRLSLTDVDSSLFTLASLLGVPGVVISAVGAVLLVLDSRWRFRGVLIAGLILVILVFFVFLYSSNAKRLLAYVVPLAAIASVELLARLPGGTLRTAAAGMFVAASLLPFPSAAVNRHWAALWPAPPSYLQWLRYQEARSVGLEPGAVRIMTRPVRSVMRWSIPASVVTARHRVEAGPRLGYEPFRRDDSVLSLYDEQVDAAGKYQQDLQIGNVLRKRVKSIPSRMLAPILKLGSTIPVASVNGVDIHRLVVPGLRGSWLLAANRGSESAVLLAAGASPIGEVEPGRLSAVRQVASLVDRRPAVIVVETDQREATAALLSLLVWSPDLLVLDREQYARAAASFDAGLPREIATVAGLTVSQVRAAGREFAVVEIE